MGPCDDYRDYSVGIPCVYIINSTDPWVTCEVAMGFTGGRDHPVDTMWG